jgi:hypothetical protein
VKEHDRKRKSSDETRQMEALDRNARIKAKGAELEFLYKKGEFD